MREQDAVLPRLRRVRFDGSAHRPDEPRPLPLHRAIATDPVVADKTRFAIIGFAQYAHVLQPLVDLSDLAELPELEVRGTTNFGKAFTVLKQAIEDDVRELKREGHRPYRPAVFFLSDGRPTDKDWRSAHRQTRRSRVSLAPQHHRVRAW